MTKPKQKLDLKKNRIRAFFLSLEGKSEKTEEAHKLYEDIEKDGMKYIQMRLPVERITKEFEESLKEKIDHNIIKANIREAKHEDLESLINMYNRAWLTSNTPFRPINPAAMKIILEDPDVIILIAKVYGIDGGFVILDFEEEKTVGIIAGLGIIPRFQRRGLGTILGMAAWKYLKEYYNIRELRCEVYKDNNVSHSFIKWIGFEESGVKVYKKEDFTFDEKKYTG